MKGLQLKHGAISVCEMTAEVYSHIRSMGGKYISLSDENICAMQDYIACKYGQPK